MKRWKAAACAVLAGLMLAGCGSKEVISCRAEGPAAAVDLTQYVVREAAYPAYPAEPRFEDYFDENGEGDWDAYDAAYTEYREALQKLGKLDAEPDGGAVLAFANRTLGKIFADSENRVYSPISLYVALSMLTEMTAGETKQQVMELLSAADSETLRQTVRDLWMSVYLDDGRSVCRLAHGAFLLCVLLPGAHGHGGGGQGHRRLAEPEHRRTAVPGDAGNSDRSGQSAAAVQHHIL